MPSFVVLAGADVEMAEGNGISARIDLNLHLAPPVAADFLRLGPGMENDEEPRQPPPRQGPQDRGIQRRILPRFGPGIHGVFLDLHPEGDPEARIRPAMELSMRPPIRHNRFRRFTSSPSLVSLPSVDGPQRSRRLFQESPRVGPGIDHPSKDKAPAKEAEEEEEEEDGGAAKGRGGLVKGGGGDNFECNVCLDMAVEPVVTVCGHLFCWSCLHQWLYVHSDNEECPVCKGSVGEGSIIPIYGRGSSSNSIRQRRFWQEEGRVLPPRPQARRVDGFRRSLTAEAAAAAAAAAGPVEEELDSELSEMFRVSRMVRLLHGNMSTTFRRRMAERREHYRMPAVPATSTNATAAAAAPPPPGEFDTRAATFQEEYVRQLSASRVDTEERVNAIRARLASLVETIESHRRQAASMAARLQESAGEIGGAVAAAAAASWPLPEPVAATAETVERAGSVSSGPRSREREEGSSSGSGDTDSEVLHSRKRRRLN